MKAYDAALRCCRAVEVSLDGSRLATASERGTLVRVFSVASGECLVELRRGAEPAMIYSLAFSKTVRFLCRASSD